MDFIKAKQKKNKNEKAPLKLIGVIIFVVLIILTGFLVFFFNFLRKGRTTLVLVGSSATVVSLDNEKDSLTIVPLPQNIYLELAGGKGNLTVQSLFKFDLLSKQKGLLFIRTLREFLGIPIDGWINIGENFEISNQEQFLNIQKKQLSLFNLKNLLPISKKQYFFYKIGNIRKDKITVIDLTESNIFQKETLPDGSQVLKTDADKLDSLLQEQFFEKKILEENLSMAVLNSGRTQGLASRAARIIGNSGGKVVIVGDSPTKMVDCTINVAKKNKKTYTVSRYKKIFSCEINNNPSEENRVDITITLGTAYEKEIKGP